MAFTVLLPKKVEKQVSKLPTEIFNQVIKELTLLQSNPLPHNSKKLKDRNGYRIRLGDYRIIYELNVDTNEIVILRVAHRKDIYKK